MKLRFLFSVIPLVITWPSMLGQMPVKNPLHNKSPASPGEQYLTVFDPKTIDTIEGTVTRVYTVPSPNVRLTSIQLLVRTADGDVHVNVAPLWFLQNQDLQFEAEDKLVITGSKVKPKGIVTMVATQVRRGEETLTVRGNDGMPVWVAWRWPPRAESETTAARAKPERDSRLH
jgi:hypothetical protein